LVHETSARGGTGSLGYTVAQYDHSSRSPPPHHQTSTTITSHRYFGDSEDLRARQGDSTVDSGLGSYNATSPRPHRYFEAESTHHEEHPPPLPKSPPPNDDSPSNQFEMTRSAEVRLYHDEKGSLRPSTIKTQDLTSYVGPIDVGNDRIEERGYDYRVTSDSSTPHLHQIETSRRAVEQQISPAPLGDLPPRDYEQPPIIDQLSKSKELHGVPIDSALHQRPAFEEQIHKKQPSGSSLTPSTRRKLFEHNIQKSANLQESSFEYQSESDAAGSKHSSKPTTPKLSFKFSKDKTRDPSKGFDFGKSKFVSKHEVVRLGKDVEVKLESLKLGKEDTLKVVVTRKYKLYSEFN
jgi:hypothetical protein